MDGCGAARGTQAFLRSFTGLRGLKLRYFNLGRLPEVLAQLQLEELILSDCAISLSPEAHATLAAQDQMTTLDMYNNPLGLVPDVGSMPNLNYIDLSHTGITELPKDLLTRPRLSTALLNDNRIEELPTALFSLPPDSQEGFDLGNNPLSSATRERLKQHYLATHQDFGIYADAADLRRAQALYPMMDQEEASKFVYSLPGTLGEGRIELSRLEAELATLENELSAWTADIPALHPATQQPFNAQQLLNEHWARDEFRQVVLRCWRRETGAEDMNDLLQPSYDLSLDTHITGDLPTLSADFSHVTMVYLNSESGMPIGVSPFLERFPKLKTLSIRDFHLGDIPEAIFRMGELTSLNLPDCHITLTAQSVLNLSEMTQLDFLDLSNNPLELAPDVTQLTELATLQLDNCQLTELPAGLLQLKRLDTADLSGNQITRIPTDILELPMEDAETINLRDNPFNEASLKILIEYFKLTNIDFGVEEVITRAELEVSSSGESDPDE
jgi:Leucine-rich repeat (LRR) protein